MGYRFQRQSEEQPIFAPQGADPSVFLRARQNVAQSQMQQSEDSLAARNRVNEMDLQSTRDFWQNAAGAVDKGIGAYRDAKKANRDEREFESKQRMSEEEFAGLQARNKLDKEFAPQERVVGLESQKANVALTGVQTEGARADTAGKVDEQAWFNTKGADGRTNRQVGFDEKLAGEKANTAVMLKRVDNEKIQHDIALAQLEQNKKMAPLEMQAKRAEINASYVNSIAAKTATQAAQMGIDQTKKEERIKTYTAMLSNPAPGQDVGAITKQMQLDGASPGEMAQAIMNMKSNQTQKKMMEALLPENAFATNQIMEGKKQLGIAKTALAEFDSASKQYDNAVTGKDSATIDDALNRLKRVAAIYGLEGQAEDAKKWIGIGTLGRTANIQKLRRDVADAAAGNIVEYAGYSPEFGPAMEKLRAGNLVPQNSSGGGVMNKRFGQQQQPGMSTMQPQAPNQSPAQYIDYSQPAQPAAPMPPPLSGGPWKKIPQTTTQAKR